MRRIYFDNAATTRVSDSVRGVVCEAMSNDFGNPSSRHTMGVVAERYIRTAKESIADILKVHPDEIYFTSGGTEGNNLAVLGTALAKRREGKRVITTQIEHPSVSEPAKYLRNNGFEVVYLPVDSRGVVDPDDVRKLLTDDTILVSVMAVNNETGAVEPVEKIGELVSACCPHAAFHVDAVQAFGKTRVFPKRMHANLLTVSGHKIHGPKGAGFIYIKNNTKIVPLTIGGGQQKGMRSGTENVPGIAGLGKAAKDAYDKLPENAARMEELKNLLTDGIRCMENTRIFSGDAPHIVSAGFSGIRSEVLLHALEEKGVYVSSGSACSSNKSSVSSTLKAMNVGSEYIDSTLRFSFCKDNTPDEVWYCLDVLNECLPMLRKYGRR